MKKSLIFTLLVFGATQLLSQTRARIWDYSKNSLVGGIDMYFSDNVGFAGLRGFSENKTLVATRFGLDWDTPAWGVQYTYGTGLLNHSITTRHYIFRGRQIRNRPTFTRKKRMRKHKFSLN